MGSKPRPRVPDIRHHDVASDRGGERAAAICTLIETAKLNGIDPQAWLADVLSKLPDHPAKRIDQLLPWQWVASTKAIAAA